VSALKESCGVVAISSENGRIIEKMFYAMLALQHRGEESAGMLLLNNGRLRLRKGIGKVLDVFPPEKLLSINGCPGIGHVRYSTVGSPTTLDAQPFKVPMKGRREIGLAHNGNIVNIVELRKTLAEKGLKCRSRCDAEVLLKTIKMLSNSSIEDIPSTLKELPDLVEGAYSATMLSDDGTVISFRDPLGFKPLCYGRGMENTSELYFASESVALDVNDARIESDVEPGSYIIAKDGEIVERGFFCKLKRRAYCMFEYVYFARPDSVLEGRSVYNVRMELGRNLARTYEIDVDVIIPVPDTSRPAAEGMSRETGIDVAEGLIKNRYVGRTFIQPTHEQRRNSIKIKLNPLRSVVENKRIAVIDDSIVRGLTAKRIVTLLRKAGAKEIHFFSTCPPIVSPCFYGIDIGSHDELIAAYKTVNEIRRIIGADKLYYQTIDGLVKAIGLPKDSLCLACLTGIYPTEKAQRIIETVKESKIEKVRRYWEVDV